MKIYVNEEFTGLTKDTDLISIGLVAENGSTFYGELTDFNIAKCDQWVKDNVVSKLKYYNKYDYYYKENNHSVEILDSKHRVGVHLNLWLNSFLEEIQFVSDVGHYDFTLLIDLLTQGKSALDLPEYISPALYDINQLIAQKLDIAMHQAFDLNREELLVQMHRFTTNADPTYDKHNALWDAFVIKELYSAFTEDVGRLEEIRDTYTTIGDVTLEQFEYLHINFFDLWMLLLDRDSSFLSSLEDKIDKMHVRNNL